MDTNTPLYRLGAAILALSPEEEIERRKAVLSQLVRLRGLLSLQQSFIHVVRLGLSLVHPIPAVTARLLQEHEYGTVTMNDTDQILADLAEVL